MSRQALDLMNKAQQLTQRIDALEKGKGKPCCEGMAKMGSCKAGCPSGHTSMEKADGHESKIKNCLKKKGGAASLKECADECGVSTEECKKIIDKMDDVKISPHGDVVLMDGLQKGSNMAKKDNYCMKNFGKKYSECSEKEKAQCDRLHGKPDKDDKMKELEMVEHDGKKVPKFAVDGKGAKDMKNKEMPMDMPMDMPMNMPMDMPMKKPKDMEEGKKPKKKEGDKGRKIKVKKPKMRDMPLPKDMDMPSPVDVQKAVAEGSQPGFITSYDSSPMGVMFMSETGGQTRNAYYTTNQYPYNAEDVANKGATSVQISLDKLASMLNPHEGGGVSRLDDGGVLRDDPY